MNSEALMDLDDMFPCIIKWVTAEKTNDTVNVFILVDIDNEKVNLIKQYHNVLTTGRAEFQEFCRDFELEYTDGHIDLNEAKEAYCYADFARDNWIIKLIPAEEDEMDFFDNLFGKVILGKLDNDFPDYIKNYYCFPYNEEGIEDDEEYVGSVESIRIEKDKFNSLAYVMIVNIEVTNGGIVRHFKYYINDIDGRGSYQYNEFLEITDIYYDEDTNKLIFPDDVPLLLVTIYTSRSGKRYIRNVDNYFPNSESEKSQYEVFFSNISDEI